MIRRGFSLALLFLLVNSTSGCSFAFMNKAQDPLVAPNYPVDCTSSRAAPVLDTICAGYFVANGLYWASQTACDNTGFQACTTTSSQKSAGILLSAGLAVLCGISAGSGYGYANKCEAVKSLNALCITGDEPSCRTLNPAWVPIVRASAALPPAPAAPATVEPGAADPAAKAPSAAPGCSRDTDCKGDRICVGGACQDPPLAPRP